MSVSLDRSTRHIVDWEHYSFFQAKAAADYSGTTARQAFAPRLEYQLKDEVIEALKELKKTEEEHAHNFVLLVLKKYL